MRLLTLARDLQRRKARERHGLFVAEGIRTVEELLGSPLRVRGALASPALAATPRGGELRARLESAGLPILDVDERTFADAADTEAPQGVLAIAEQPRHSLASLAAADTARERRLLVLDGVQDPGNLGTLLRTAAGLGADAVIALTGTVDLWNAKVVRAGMGAHFQLPTVGCTWDELDAFLSRAAIVLWGADGAGVPVADVAAGAPPDVALAVGNEGGGLSPAVRAAAHRLVAIPSTGRIESFNVAVAASILLYELRPRALRGHGAG